MTAQQVFRATIVIMLTVAAAYILVVSARVLLVLLIAIIIASSVRPLVNRLMKWRIPESAAIGITYLGLIGFIILISVAVFPPVVNQVAQYIENDDRLATRIITAQQWVERSLQNVTNTDVSLVAPDEIRSAVSTFVAQLRRTLPNMLNDIGGTLGDVVLIFVMGAYWLTSHERAIDFITKLYPLRYREEAQEMIDEIELAMGSYVRGVVTVSTIIGILNFIPLMIFGVPNALTLSLLIGVLTSIPIIGGLIGVILAAAMTVVIAPQFLLTVLAITFVVQQIENYLVSPRVMSGTVGIEPLLIIVYVSAGFVLFGVVGGLIAIPVMSTIHILLQHLIIAPHRENITTFQVENGVMVVKPTILTPASPAATPTPSSPPTPEPLDTPVILKP